MNSSTCSLMESTFLISFFDFRVVLLKARLLRDKSVSTTKSLISAVPLISSQSMKVLFAWLGVVGDMDDFREGTASRLVPSIVATRALLVAFSAALAFFNASIAALEAASNGSSSVEYLRSAICSETIDQLKTN